MTCIHHSSITWRISPLFKKPFYVPFKQKYFKQNFKFGGKRVCVYVCLLFLATLDIIRNLLLRNYS